MRAHTQLVATLERALDLIAPRTCAGCGTPLATGDAFCTRCADACQGPTETTLDEGLRILAASHYAGPVRVAITSLKYSGRSDLGRALGRWVAARCGIATLGGCVLVPVPLHPRRLVERGFNQAALLAAGIARPARCRIAHRAVERQRDVAPQALLSGAERRRNLEGAFRARTPLVGPVWLVDDVITTGSTIIACARVLRAGGACVQGAVCVALAGREDRGDGATQLV